MNNEHQVIIWNPTDLMTGNIWWVGGGHFGQPCFKPSTNHVNYNHNPSVGLNNIDYNFSHVG